MSENLAGWVAAGKHLPEPLRDFHDAKALFKTMHTLQQVPEDKSPAAAVDWITGQCYVVDRFLWFMARRGYTLQRSRTRLPFMDLQADIRRIENERAAQFAALVDSAAKPATPSPDKGSQDQ